MGWRALRYWGIFGRQSYQGIRACADERDKAGHWRMSDKVRVSTLPREAVLENVDGFVEALAKQSLTTPAGLLRIEPIEGIEYRGARPVSHHDGHLTEAYRADWGVTEVPVVQVNVSVTFPGRVRAWGLHRHTIDRLFASTGSLCIVCYDGRRDSRTFGAVNEFFMGERNQGLIIIPPGVFHGWKNLGDDEATIVGMPSRLYDHDGPDRWELRWDSDDARRISPYSWP
jgi:dTDP-4-dehydrorhamnose 3,5-epimerase